jgi:hypothetical protein
MKSKFYPDAGSVWRIWRSEGNITIVGSLGGTEVWKEFDFSNDAHFFGSVTVTVLRSDSKARTVETLCSNGQVVTFAEDWWNSRNPSVFGADKVV